MSKVQETTTLADGSLEPVLTGARASPSAASARTAQLGMVAVG